MARPEVAKLSCEQRDLLYHTIQRAGFPRNVVLNRRSVEAFRTWATATDLTTEERQRYAVDRDDRWVQRVFELSRPLSVATAREYFVRFLKAVPDGHRSAIGEQRMSAVPWLQELLRVPHERRPWSKLSALEHDPVGIIDPHQYRNWSRELAKVASRALGFSESSPRTKRRIRDVESEILKFLRKRAPEAAKSQWGWEKLRYLAWHEERRKKRFEIPFDPEYTNVRFGGRSRATR